MNRSTKATRLPDWQAIPFAVWAIAGGDFATDSNDSVFGWTLMLEQLTNAIDVVIAFGTDLNPGRDC